MLVSVQYILTGTPYALPALKMVRADGLVAIVDVFTKRNLINANMIPVSDDNRDNPHLITLEEGEVEGMPGGLVLDGGAGPEVL